MSTHYHAKIPLPLWFKHFAFSHTLSSSLTTTSKRSPTPFTSKIKNQTLQIAIHQTLIRTQTPPQTTKIVANFIILSVLHFQGLSSAYPSPKSALDGEKTLKMQNPQNRIFRLCTQPTSTKLHNHLSLIILFRMHSTHNPTLCAFSKNNRFSHKIALCTRHFHKSPPFSPLSPPFHSGNPLSHSPNLPLSDLPPFTPIPNNS